MAHLELSPGNTLNYELIAPRDHGATFVFFNALSGDKDMWSAAVGDALRAAGHGLLLYNLRGQAGSDTTQTAIDVASISADAMALLDHGTEFVLITGTHENTRDVQNSLYSNHRHMETFTWERLEGSFHGSGCTLASSIAGLLGQGLEPFSAIHEAQEYTWQALAAGYRIGMGQQLPNRLFWARDEQA